VLLVAPVAQAASTGARHQGFAHLPTSVLRAYAAATSIHRVRFQHIESPKAGVRAPAHQGAGAGMRVDPTKFVPATIDQDSSGPWDFDMDATWADQNSYFKGNHKASYASLGLQAGHYERASWTPSGATSAVTFRYQGALFASAAAATAALQDGVTTVQTQVGNPPTDCSNTGFSCKAFAYGYQNGDSEGYNVLQVNNCLIETAARATSAIFQANVDQIVKTQLAVDGAALSLPACSGSPGTPGTNPPPSNPPPSNPPPVSPPPTTQPSIAIDQVGLVHVVNGQAKTTTTLKNKETGLFVAFYHASNAGANTPTGSLTVRSGSRTVGTVKMQSQTASDGTTYFEVGLKFTVKKKTKYTAVFNLVLGAAKASRSFNFTVKKK
jgi:hypothetical protein